MGKHIVGMQQCRAKNETVDKQGIYEKPLVYFQLPHNSEIWKGLCDTTIEKKSTIEVF